MDIIDKKKDENNTWAALKTLRALHKCMKCESVTKDKDGCALGFIPLNGQCDQFKDN